VSFASAISPQGMSIRFMILPGLAGRHVRIESHKALEACMVPRA